MSIPHTYTIDGRKLAHLRQQRMLSQGELAIACGVPRPSIGRLEIGNNTNVRVAFAARLARALCVPIEDLLVPEEELT